LLQQNVQFYQQNVLVAAAKVLVAATKKLFVVPNFVAATKPFFSVHMHA